MTNELDGRPFPAEDRVTLAFTIMLAGLDTTRSALGYIFHHLATHQSRCPRHKRQLGHHLQHAFGWHPLTAHGHHFKGPAEQGIAGENGHGIAVHLVIGGATTPQIVVVHGRQIVVDQRHGVDHLQSHGRWHRQGGITADQLTRCQAEDRPEPLASSQE